MSQQRDFLHDVLPSTGPYFLFKLPKTQKSSTDIQELIDKCNEYSKAGKDTYYATASYKNTNNRKKDNVALKKAFYLDLDCGPGKPYADQREAMTALFAFLYTTGIPMPTWIVMSGHGVHVYWALTKSVSADKWMEVAAMLQSACEHHGLHVDVTVTCDTTRIMRLPGTFNFKEPTDPRAVTAKCTGELYPITRFENAFQKAASPAHKAIRGIVSGGKDLSGGLTVAHYPKYAKQFVDECPVFADAIATGGSSHNEPLWNSLLHVLAFCEDGESYIHTIGNQHPGYSEATTIAKFDSKLQAASQNTNLGPTTCDAIAQLSPLCKSCPHFGIIASPVSLCRPPKPAASTLETTPPFPYDLNQSRQLMLKTDDGPERLLDFIFDRVELHKYFEGPYRIVVHWRQPSDPSKRLVMTLKTTDLIDVKMFRRAVGDARGPILDQGDSKIFSIALTSWARQLEEAGQIVQRAGQFGWLQDEKTNRRGFAHGNRVSWEDGTHTDVAVSDDVLTRYYTPRGDINKWISTANKVISRNDPAINCAIAAAFASPLVELTGHNGVAISIISPESGSGKSAGMKIGAAVWGDPEQTINSLDDTFASVIQKMGRLNNLPAYWDELRPGDDINKFLNDILFRITQGRSKQRLDPSAALKETYTWNTMLCCASNEFLLDRVQEQSHGTNAGMLRLLELLSKPIPASEDGTYMTVEIADLKENYGHAGVVYGTWLVRNRDVARQLTLKMIYKFKAVLTDPGPERFRIAAASSLMAGAAIANRLNLTKFDLKIMEDYLIDFFTTRSPKQTFAQTLNIAEIVDLYITDMAERIYVSQCVPFGRGNPGGVKKNSGFGDIYYQDKRGGGVVGIHGRDDDRLRLVKGPFDRWARRNGYMPTTIEHHFIRHPAIVMGQRTVSVPGTDAEWRSRRPICYDIEKSQL